MRSDWRLLPGDMLFAQRVLAVADALVPLDPVEIEAAVGEVLHRALCACPAEIGEIDVADRQSLDIFGGLGRDPVPREGEVARSEDTGLGVLNVHVGDVRQVADIAAHHDEALVLDRAGADQDLPMVLAGLQREGGGQESLPLTERDLPIKLIGGAILLLMLPIIGLTPWKDNTCS